MRSEKKTSNNNEANQVMFNDEFNNKVDTDLENDDNNININISIHLHNK